VGDHIYKKVVGLVQSGDFSTPAEVAKTALIEWLRDKDRGLMTPGKSVGEAVRDEILFALYNRGQMSAEEINADLARKGLEQDPEQLKAHLFILAKAGEVEETKGEYSLGK
jgi:Arc/MetJ-type ribon-helix-helix transcriptional regulator